MKQDIHPAYQECEYTCACGAVYKMNSTSTKSINLDVCSACHPFYSGAQKKVSTNTRVNKFNAKFGNFVK